MEARAIKNGNVRIEAEERNSKSFIIKTFEAAVVTHSHASLLLLHHPGTGAKGFMISRRSQLSSIYYYQGSINSKATKML